MHHARSAAHSTQHHTHLLTAAEDVAPQPQRGGSVARVLCSAGDPAGNVAGGRAPWGAARPLGIRTSGGNDSGAMEGLRLNAGVCELNWEP